MTEETKMKIIYTGRRTAKGKTYFLFGPHDLIQAKLIAGEEIGSALSMYSGKGVTHKTVGGIYEATASLGEDGRLHTIRFGTLAWAGTFAHEAVGGWRAEDEAVGLELRAKQMETKAKGMDPLMRDVDILKRHYQSLGYAQRLPFKLWLFAELDRK